MRNIKLVKHTVNKN